MQAGRCRQTGWRPFSTGCLATELRAQAAALGREDHVDRVQHVVRLRRLGRDVERLDARRRALARGARGARARPTAQHAKRMNVARYSERIVRRNAGTSPRVAVIGAGIAGLTTARTLLDHGIEVHGQVVVCPGINDGDVLDDTLLGVLDRFPELQSVAVVSCGITAPLTVTRTSMPEGAATSRSMSQVATVPRMPSMASRSSCVLAELYQHSL